MNYTVYVGDRCTDCENLVQYVKDKDLPITLLNIDRDKSEIPNHIFVIPALANGDQILAYGMTDIIAMLEK